MYINPIVAGFFLCILSEIALFIVAAAIFKLKKKRVKGNDQK